MKWPAELLLLRHAESAYNELALTKKADPEYQRFVELFHGDRTHPELMPLAHAMQKKYALGVSDRETLLTARGEQQARLTGRALAANGTAVPDVLYCSPFLRTRRTLELIQQEWPALQPVLTYFDDRIREQDHGLSLVYNDWRIYQLMHPEQEKLRELLGAYDYRFLNGENVPDVRLRNLSWIATLTREFAGKRVLVVTHHLNILATRANFERHSLEQFIHFDQNDKPLNCSLTRYVGHPGKGSQGKLELAEYNTRYYPEDL